MDIINLIDQLPWHKNRKWQSRKTSQINRIIIHQELGEGSIEDVNNYHINPNHISPKGCPHFCYHYGIRKNGEVVQANALTDITWHTKGQNSTAVGIMLVGNFNGSGYSLGTSEPTKEQIKALRALVNHLRKALNLSNLDIYGHYHFGKRACPGHTIEKWIEKLRNDLPIKPDLKNIPKTIKDIQTRLNKLEYDCGKPDGIPGPKTSRAIRAFQHDYDLVVDGVVGPQTWQCLLELTNK